MNLYKLRTIWLVGIICWVYSIYYGFSTGDWSWPLLAFIISKIVVIPANHIAMHRYFTHRSFVTTKVKHIFLTWSSILIGAGSPILYATSHRHHHRYSDKEYDIHSPKNSLLESLGLWEIKPFHWFKDEKNVRILPKDLIRDTTVQFVHHHYFAIWAVIALVSIIFGFLINWKIPVFCVAAPLGWYIFGSGVFVTTLSHIKTPISYRNFETEDNSQNNKWIHWYTLGEGLHNNHHAHPEEYNQAMRKGEFDFSGWLVKTIFIVDSNDKNAHKLK
jgi:stearoyl-CoA desaturase (delta-9 desaturase)